MAVPNIAALTELYGGSLAWELTPAQPVFSYDGKRYQTAGGTYNWTSSWTSASPSYVDISYTVPTSHDNRLLVFVGASVDYWGSEKSEIISTTTAPTYAGVSMTELTTSSTMDLPYGGKLRVWYLVNPATGTNNIRFTAANHFTSNYTRLLNYEINTFYNVNQSQPFKIQLNNSTDDAGLVCYRALNWGHYGGSTSPAESYRQNMTFTASPGDLCINWFTREQWVQSSYSDPNSTNYSFKSTTDGITWEYYNAHSAYGNYWYSHYVSVPSSVSGGEVNLGYLPSSFSSSGYQYNYHRMSGVTIQQANAATLFTVPTGYAVKVNQIYAGSSSAGLAMSAQIKGLAAQGQTPSTLRNTTNTADLITTTTANAVGNIAAGITVVPGQQTKLLTQPVWLQEGNQLAVGVGFGQAQMKSTTELKPAPTATCTVSMEIIKT